MCGRTQPLANPRLLYKVSVLPRVLTRVLAVVAMVVARTTGLPTSPNCPAGVIGTVGDATRLLGCIDGPCLSGGHFPPLDFGTTA